MICIKNGTIHTAVDPQPFTGDILIGGGKILRSPVTLMMIMNS